MSNCLKPLPSFEAPGSSRSQNMAAIRSANTKPELYVRKALYAAGFRFRLHRRDLPGRPDIVLPRYQTVVQVQGCYWHGHGCKSAHVAKTNKPYWSAKIARNVARDSRNTKALEDLGWNVAVVWECSLGEQTERLLHQLEQRRRLISVGGT